MHTSQDNHSYKYNCKYVKENFNKLKSVIYQKNDTSWPNKVYSRCAKWAHHYKSNNVSHQKIKREGKKEL